MKKKKLMIRIGLIILALLLISGSIWLALKFNEMKLSIKEMREELDTQYILNANMQNKISFIQKEFDRTRAELDSVSKKLAASQSDNVKLVMEKKALEEELHSLEAKMHSLKELKAAIRQVKMEMHQKKQEQALAKKAIQKENDDRKLAEGNRGFLSKDGKTTHEPIVRIEVRPVY